MTIKVKDPADLEQKFMQLARSVRILRTAQIYYSLHFGGLWKQVVDDYSAKVDRLLSDIGLPFDITEIQNIRSIREP